MGTVPVVAQMPLNRMVLAALAVSLASCGRDRLAGPIPVPKPAPAEFKIPSNREPEDLARFIAGLDGKEGSPYRVYELQLPWLVHAKATEQQWERFERNRLPAMTAFQKRELAGPPVDGSTVFYPFGGPDVLTVATFFPRNRDYILIGLEPPGTLPSFAQVVESKSLDAQLPAVRRTLSSLLKVSFFVTREMDFQLRGQIFNGVLPVILAQMARLRFQILGISSVTLNDNGEIVERSPAAGPLNSGVAIEFREEGDPLVHRLYYFSVNLASGPLSRNRPFLAYLQGRQRLTSFFKSTSYMPHQQGFERIRGEVLAHSAIVVQDDSGIPFRFFDHDHWRVQLYGGYDRPYGSFRNLQQKDLKTAFENGEEVRKLGFPLGYGFGRIPSNLIVARRKG